MRGKEKEKRYYKFTFRKGRDGKLDAIVIIDKCSERAAIALCSPEDSFCHTLGKRIALNRLKSDKSACTGKYVRSFEELDIMKRNKVDRSAKDYFSWIARSFFEDCQTVVMQDKISRLQRKRDRLNAEIDAEMKKWEE